MQTIYSVAATAATSESSDIYKFLFMHWILWQKNAKSLFFCFSFNFDGKFVFVFLSLERAQTDYNSYTALHIDHMKETWLWVDTPTTNL